MAKYAPDAFYTNGFAYIAGVTRMVGCSQQPTTYTEAVTTYALADVNMASGDFTEAAGDTSGRKITVAAKNAVPVDAGGTVTHIALVTVTGSTLRYVTTCDDQVLTQGNTMNFPAWDIEIAAPS